MDVVTLALAKKYTADTVIGMGAIKGDKGDKGRDGISPTVIVNTNTDDEYTLSISDSKHSFITPNLKGAKGDTGAQGIRGEKGEQGVQGIQGLTGAKGDKGDKGDDGYPFLIYKQYDSISEFHADDFPEIGLMFMVMEWVTDKGYPIYRYIGDDYSLVTYMNSEGIKGEKGDKGDKGDTGEKGADGLNGADGTTYTPSIKSVSTLDSDSSAIVSVEINEINKTAGFSFGIPRGKDGKDGKDGSLIPVGSIIAFGGTSAPSGWLVCDGSAVSRAMYSDLFAVIGTAYGSGDGSTTFNLPDLRGKFAEGTPNGGTVGTSIDAGLPNITGTEYTWGWAAQKNGTNGAFAVSGAGSLNMPSTMSASDRGYAGWTLDASRSSAIYGKSTTVQPPAVCVNYIIRVSE